MTSLRLRLRGEVRRSTRAIIVTVLGRSNGFDTIEEGTHGLGHPSPKQAWIARTLPLLLGPMKGLGKNLAVALQHHAGEVTFVV